jgi:phenylpropionate dioxygenase-like ring-hydroxylating dioxygenase large terminal subunit
MRPDRQIELLQRVADAGPHLAGLQGADSYVNPASAYTDPDRFEAERRILFRDGPVLFALSCELSQPGSYQTAMVGGVPVVVIRQGDGSLRALVNACRHRGAPLLEPGTQGADLRALSCPYHAWTYNLEGSLTARPLSAGAFDDVTLNCDLHPRAVAEAHGMIFVRAGGTDPIDAEAVLGGAQDDLGAFQLDTFVPIESRTNTLNMNWKLVLDTFCESYHIRTLHRDSLAPMFNSDTTIFEAFGRNLVSIGLRKNVLDETAKPQEEWSLLPYGTIQYFLVPRGLVVYQLDHVEVWRVEPIDVRTTRATTTIYAPSPPETESAHRYWIKNLDLLLQVTGTEDFPLMERIQANLDSGALPQLVYGRNEAPLIHLHRSVNAAIGH